MITPIELQSKTFKNGIGYDKKDVDNFLSNLLNDYETLYKDNMELNDKISTLNEGIQYYRTIEKTLQKALVLAEQTAEDTKEAARKQANAIEEEAKGKAQIIIADAKNDLFHIKQQIIKLIEQYDSYKARFKHLAAAQFELLDSDCFAIHITNLDSFADDSYINNQTMTLGTNKDTSTNQEASINYELNNSTNNNREIEDADDDFEFINLDEDEV